MDNSINKWEYAQFSIRFSKELNREGEVKRRTCSARSVDVVANLIYLLKKRKI